ncbi:hypothetical protein [Paenibacillus xylanexedens]|nr:hypothetical protein [Paenibacillus xylanexedens]
MDGRMTPEGGSALTGQAMVYSGLSGLYHCMHGDQSVRLGNKRFNQMS